MSITLREKDYWIARLSANIDDAVEQKLGTTIESLKQEAKAKVKANSLVAANMEDKFAEYQRMVKSKNEAYAIYQRLQKQEDKLEAEIVDAIRESDKNAPRYISDVQSLLNNISDKDYLPFMPTAFQKAEELKKDLLDQIMFATSSTKLMDFVTAFMDNIRSKL
jgi:hypothetical protein